MFNPWSYVVSFAIYVFVAWGLSELITFATGYDLGFWRTFAGLIAVCTVAVIVALAVSSVRSSGSDTQEYEVVTESDDKITLAINVKRASDLDPAAYYAGRFVNTLREMTGKEYALDINAGVSGDMRSNVGPDGAPVVGFIQPYSNDEDGEDDDYEEDRKH